MDPRSHNLDARQVLVMFAGELDEKRDDLRTSMYLDDSDSDAYRAARTRYSVYTDIIEILNKLLGTAQEKDT